MIKLEHKNLTERFGGQYSNRHAQRGDQRKSPCIYQEGSPGSVLAVTQRELVKEVLCQAIFRGPQLAQVGDMVPQLFDEHHLFMQVVMLEEVTHVAVLLLGGQLVQIQQALVHSLRQLQGALHDPQATVPVLFLRLGDVAQTEITATLALQPQQLLRVLPLLVGLPKEEQAEVLQAHVFPVKVEGHGHVHVGGVQLQVDQVVDGGLTLRVVVVTHMPGRKCSCHVR